MCVSVRFQSDRRKPQPNRYMVDVENLLNPTIVSDLGLYWPSHVTHSAVSRLPDPDKVVSSLMATAECNDNVPMLSTGADPVCVATVQEKQRMEEKTDEEDSGTVTEFRLPSLKKARETRNVWYQRAQEMREKVETLLQGGTIPIAEVLKRVPESFFLVCLKHNNKYAQNTLFYQLIWMSLNGDIQLELMTMSKGDAASVGSFRGIRSIVVPKESRELFDSMPVSSRAAGKKNSKRHEPITKIWKDACLYERKREDGSLLITFETLLVEENKQKQELRKQIRRRGPKAQC